MTSNIIDIDRFHHCSIMRSENFRRALSSLFLIKLPRYFPPSDSLRFIVTDCLHKTVAWPRVHTRVTGDCTVIVRQRTSISRVLEIPNSRREYPSRCDIVARARVQSICKSQIAEGIASEMQSRAVFPASCRSIFLPRF